jgi:hypothetical protein
MDADADCNSFATERMMIERRDVEFEVEGGCPASGHLDGAWLCHSRGAARSSCRQ